MSADPAPLAIDRYEALLRRIQCANDVSHARACTYRSLDAGEISHIAAGFAGTWMWNRRASLAELEIVIDILAMLSRAAAMLERLEKPA
jgi:hypothetical protein